jgi:uncharacterized protein YjdB
MKPLVLIAALAYACGEGEGAEIQGSGPVATISVIAPTTRILAGETVQLTATALDPGGNALERSFEWRSGIVTVATVSPSGLVTGQGKGRSRIYATTDDLTSSIIITVDVAPRAD